MTRAEINTTLDEANIEKIVIADDRAGSGVWYVNLHRADKPAPAGYYGEGPDIFAALENAVRRIKRGGHALQME